jgi:hypothetical protein
LLNVYVYLRPRYMKQRRQHEMLRRLQKSKAGHSTSTGTGYNFNQSTNASHSHSHLDGPCHNTIGEDNNNQKNHNDSCGSLELSTGSWKSFQSREVDVGMDHTNDDSTPVDKVEDTELSRKEADDSRTLKDKTRHLETVDYAGKDETPTNTTTNTTDCTIEFQVADVIPDQIPDVDTDDNDSFDDTSRNDEDKIVDAPLQKDIV